MELRLLTGERNERSSPIESNKSAPSTGMVQRTSALTSRRNTSKLGNLYALLKMTAIRPSG